MSESGQSWQQQLPGRPEFSALARRWVTSHVAHPDAATLTAELWIGVLTGAPDLIVLTVSTAGRRVRITAYGPAPVALDALGLCGQRIVAALATTYGIAPDGCGLYAEITR